MHHGRTRPLHKKNKQSALWLVAAVVGIDTCGGSMSSLLIITEVRADQSQSAAAANILLTVRQRMNRLHNMYVRECVRPWI